MISKVFTIFDTKAGYYLTPFFALNAGMALRSFEDMVNNDQTTLFLHPEDYSLICLGEYDDSVGVIVTSDHANLGNGATYKKLATPIEVQNKKEIGDMVNELKNYISNLLLSQRISAPPVVNEVKKGILARLFSN